VWRWRETADAAGRTVTVKLRYANFEQTTRSRTVAAPIADRSAFTAITVELVRGLFPLRRPVRLLGVTLSHFDEPGRPGDGQMTFGF